MMNTDVTTRPSVIRSIVSGVAATMLVVTLAACGSDSEQDSEPTDVMYGGDDMQHEHGTGSDDHIDIDPVKDDPTIAATAAAVNWWTWLPGEQSSAWAVSGNTAETTLTGDLKDRADNADSDDADEATPDDWEQWAQTNTTVSALVLSATEDEGGSDTETTVTLDIRQNTTADGGATDTLDEFQATAHLVAEDGQWKVSALDKL